VSHQLVECVFDVFVGCTLVLQGLNGGIELANVGIEGFDVLLDLDVVGNKGIDFLVACVFH
jgi:hypothetical protein